MFRFDAAEDILAQETLPVIGWRLETLSDVSFDVITIATNDKVDFEDRKSTQAFRVKNYLLKIFRKTSSFTRECRPAWCSSCPTPPWRPWSSARRMTTLLRSGPTPSERQQLLAFLSQVPNIVIVFLIHILILFLIVIVTNIQKIYNRYMQV